MPAPQLTRWERKEVTAAVIGAALLRAYRLTLSTELRAPLHISKAEAIAEYRRLAKAAVRVMAACRMECT